MWLFMRLSLIILIMTLGCSNSDHLQVYLKNIPEKEEVNASLYHYELIVNEIRREFSNQNYYKVFDLYQKYLTVFFESNIPHEEELLYWVGRSVREVVGAGMNPQDGGEGEAFYDYLKSNEEGRIKKVYLGIKFEWGPLSNRQSLKSKQSKDSVPEKLIYKGQHFLEILNQRGNYEWEKLALREIYTSKFVALSPNSHNLNLDHGYWLASRYPDLFPPENYRSIIVEWIGKEMLSELSRSRKEKWDRIEDIFRVSRWANESTELAGSDFPEVCFPISGPVVVYNRAHWISSRNLASLALWEPFSIRVKGIGEDGKTWYAVTFRNGKRGFIDLENVAEACEMEWGPRYPAMVKEYLAGYESYLSQDYLKTTQILSELLYDLEELPNPDMYIMERSWTLLYQTLKEIATRSTSLDNPFIRFVLEHSEYFVVSRDLVHLEVSDYFLKKIIQYDRSSPMLQYFEGFNKL